MKAIGNNDKFLSFLDYTGCQSTIDFRGPTPMIRRLVLVIGICCAATIESHSADAPVDLLTHPLLRRTSLLPVGHAISLRWQIEEISKETKVAIRLSPATTNIKPLGPDTKVVIKGADDDVELFYLMPVVLASYSFEFSIENDQIVINLMEKKTTVWREAFRKRPEFILKGLQKRIDIEVEGAESPFSDVIEYLSDLIGSRIFVYRLESPTIGIEIGQRSWICPVPMKKGDTIEEFLTRLLTKMNSVGIIMDDRIYLVLNEYRSR